MNAACWCTWLRASPWLLAIAACEIPDRTITEEGASGGSAGTSLAGAASGMSPGEAGSGDDDGAAGSGEAGGSAGGGGRGGAAGSGGTGGSAAGGGGDACPDDPKKTEPGKCGCDAPDQDSATGASCIPLQNSLVHRYSFDGDAKDSVGSGHGALQGGASISGGALVLAGNDSGQYLDLPNGIISSLTDATIEAWVTWTGSADGEWQRVFDFGSNNMPEGQAGIGDKYLFLATDKFRACYNSATPPSEVFTDAGVPFPTVAGTHVAVVVNSSKHTLSLYLNGGSGTSATLNLPLSAISDVNNWVGRSQYADEDYFGGKISELRIYSAALTDKQLQTSIKMGENTTYLKP